MTDPTAAQRALGFALRELCKEHGRTLSEAATAALITPGTLSKVENAKQRLNPNSVEKLLGYYDVGTADRARLLALAQAARTKARKWWETYTDLMPVAYIELEAAAEQIAYLESHLVPGLLQTKRYLEALIRAERPDITEDELQRRIEAREARQEILTRTVDPCTLLAVIDESVLHRVIGSEEVMAEQLDHILEMTHLPNVTVQIMPFAGGMYEALTVRFTLLRFAAPTDPGTVYIENLVLSDEFVENPDNVRRFADVFNRAAAAAEPPARSLAMITAARDRFGKKGKD
ncbi:transcriptional regulator [Actinorhabdospora filicis]|uniref:Transcriptional regulator n=1 Tax=Actinorhabdospora filicis TaxID=1785913 RepID=A0A9W6SU71_9ACTN|nr:helix-turn-helix transcriptional regulator [Actinorhabdospora filicis]GLZ82123.1 transcriptional regulator [Actinorhabdospora filicis]